MTSYVMRATTCALMLALAVVGRADTPALNDLLPRVPESVNTIVVLNMKSIREQSGQKGGPQIVAGSVVPGAVDLVLFATHLEPGKLEARKSMGLIQLNKSITVDDLLDRPGGSKIDLGGESAVMHPRKGYYVLLKPDLVGIGRNITRQELYRGIKFARTNNKVVIAKYLTDAIEAASGSEIVGALDMENMLDVKAVHARLTASELLAGRDPGELDSICALVASIKGASLTVGGRQLDQAEVRLEFGKRVGQRGELVKSLFLQALNDLGMALSDFQNAKVVADDQTVRLQVKLSDEGLIRIMSIFLPPTPEMLNAAAAASAGPKLESNGVSLEATKRYYQAVSTMLADVKRRSRSATDYVHTATWHETYANNIENLSAQYVDPDVLKFGEAQAGRLRSIARSLRGVAAETGALEEGSVYIGAATGTWFGGTSMNVQSNISEIRSRQAEIIRKDATRRLDLWEAIDNDQRNLVKTIRSRYGLNLE